MIVTVPVGDVPLAGPLAVRVDDQLTLAVCRVEGSYYAMDSRCPHRGANLAEGTIDGGIVICPLHHFKFNLQTGRCLMPRHLKLRSFPVIVEGETLNIEVAGDSPATAPASGAIG